MLPRRNPGTAVEDHNMKQLAEWRCVSPPCWRCRAGAGPEPGEPAVRRPIHRAATAPALRPHAPAPWSDCRRPPPPACATPTDQRAAPMAAEPAGKSCTIGCTTVAAKKLAWDPEGDQMTQQLNQQVLDRTGGAPPPMSDRRASRRPMPMSGFLLATSPKPPPGPEIADQLPPQRESPCRRPPRRRSNASPEKTIVVGTYTGCWR